MIELLMLTIFSAYVLYVIREVGILRSISASTYKLEGKKKFLFTATLASLAILNLEMPMGFYGTLTTLGLFWTGATVTFRRKGTATPMLHYAGTLLAIASAAIGLLVLHGNMAPLAVGLIFTAILLKQNEYGAVFFIEIIWFVLILLGYMTI